jgi:anthranilate phosphoribosyltransferase
MAAQSRPYAIKNVREYIGISTMRTREAIEKIRMDADLTRQEAREVMLDLFSGSVPDDTIAAFLVSLRNKGEKAQELVGFAEVMRDKAAESLIQEGIDPEQLRKAEPLLDTCGTGGDGKGTFNVSTGAALVAAGAGVRVAKHGNRSISSRCGSADVLEALGVHLDIPLAAIADCLVETGIAFLLAPKMHTSMKHVMNARRSLKSKTVFNLLGPLTNPLHASEQLVGVYDWGLTEMLAEVLQGLGSRRAMVVAGADGIDEITTTGRSRLSEAYEGSVSTREVTPEDFGVSVATVGALAGGDCATNADLLNQVLAGAAGPYRNVVLVNASAALVAAGKAPDFRVGVGLARESIDSGCALDRLQKLIAFTRKFRN